MKRQRAGAEEAKRKALEEAKRRAFEELAEKFARKIRARSRR